MFTGIVEEMLRQHRRPDLITHVTSLGPTEWTATGNKIMKKNRMMGMAFMAMANYLTKLEDSPEDWHLAPVRGQYQSTQAFSLLPG
jgi:hypothetical protein